MTHDTTASVPVKPRVLIADDSRIVRTALVRRIGTGFEFREALDGEQAWEMLLLDPAIRVVITDLTMPRLDGYGLLARIRNSRVRRIREVPVVVISGSDEQDERARARAAGATDLITKGIAAPHLLARLKILSRPDVAAEAGDESQVPDIGMALQWLRDGRHADVVPHLPRLRTELAPLLELMRDQDAR